MFIILIKQLLLSTNISSVVEQQKIIFIIFMFDTRSKERFSTLWRCKARHNIYIQEKLVFNQNNKLVWRILDNHLCKYIECPEIEILLVFNMSIQFLAIELENNKAFMILNIIISINFQWLHKKSKFYNICSTVMETWSVKLENLFMLFNYNRLL